MARPLILVLAGALSLLVASGCRTLAPPSGHVATWSSRSGPIALAPDGRSVWVVNPDADSVTRVDTRRLTAGPPLLVGREPTALAVGPGERVVVANRASGDLSVWFGGARRDIGVGAEPAGVALSPSGRFAFVTLAAEGRVVKVDLEHGAIVATAVVDAAPAAIVAFSDQDGASGAAPDDDAVRLAVTHLLAFDDPGDAGPDARREGRVTLLDADLTVVGQRAIEPYAFGSANLLTGVAVHGDRMWVAHTLTAPGEPVGFNRTVSAALSGLAVSPDAAEVRLHLNDPTFSTPVNGPRAVAFSSDGANAYVVLAGSDQLMGIDVRDPDAPRLLGFWPTGPNPRGVALSLDGRSAFVSNHLGRDVSVIDLSDPTNRRGGLRVRVVDETLSPAAWLGARLFHHAADPRMSTLGWVSCASCHPGGGSDGVTWSTPEGPRQTRPLWALSLTGPPFHASATRDEAQDFNEDVERLMRGTGLLPGGTNALLGEPNAGRSEPLDALATFVLDGFRVPTAPPAGAAAARGRAVFAGAGCADCHGGPGWTRNALPGPPGTLAPHGELVVRGVLFDVGTFRPESGPLGAEGFKVPTLLGLHASAPYLHDGSAADLRAVLAEPRHAGVLDEADVEDLVAFLLSIDAATPPFD